MSNLKVVVSDLMKKQDKSALIIEKETGLNRSTTYSIANGTCDNPNLSTLKLLAQGLNVPVQALIAKDYTNDDEEAYYEKLSFLEMKAFMETGTATVDKLEEIQVNLTMNQLLQLVSDLYQYAIGVEPPSVDKRYIDHMVEKKFKDKV